MGAGVLPATIHNGVVYFLFGKESKFEKTAPGFSDFGGGIDDGETPIQTAVREAGEELTGFLGSSAVVRRLLRRKFVLRHDPETKKHGPYFLHIFPYAFDPALPKYFNNNRAFIGKHLPTRTIRATKIFEKAEIRWIPITQLARMRPQFRHYFRDIIDLILKHRDFIRRFLSKGMERTVRRRHVLDRK